MRNARLLGAGNITALEAKNSIEIDYLPDTLQFLHAELFSALRKDGTTLALRILELLLHDQTA
jgi:hypothetical protein